MGRKQNKESKVQTDREHDKGAKVTGPEEKGDELLPLTSYFRNIEQCDK